MILLSVDTSAASESAIPTAIKLACRFQTPLRVVLILDGPLRHHFDQVSRELGTTAAAAATSYLNQIVTAIRERGAQNVDGEFRHAADAGRGIVEIASEPDVAMIVMATHGRSGLSRWLTGSVTEHVIRASPVPVVVVPTATDSLQAA